MHFNRNRRRSLLTAKNFTITMVLVNAAGFALVQQKMQSAEVDNAFALDDGVRPMVAVRQADLPERQVLPEIELAAAAPSRPFVELPELKPLPQLALELELAEEAHDFASAPLRAESRETDTGRAKVATLAVARPAPVAVREAAAEPELKLTRIDRIPAPSAGMSAEPSASQHPILIEALPSSPAETGMYLTHSPGDQDGFTAAFGRDAQPQSGYDATATFGAPTADNSPSAGSPLEIDSIAPSVWAPATDLPASSAEGTTNAVPAPSTMELPPTEPIDAGAAAA